MEIIFIGGIFADNNKDIIEANSIGPIQYAADALQKSFLRGLSLFYTDLTILNMPFVGSYPKRFKKVNIEFENTYFEGIPLKSIKFINITAYKLFSRFFNLFKYLRKYLKKSTPTILLLYSIHIPYILASILLKRGNIKIILIVPDLPEFMSSENGFFRRVMLKFQNFLLRKLYKKIDGYVVLTRSMIDRMGISEEKACVIEGIYSDSKFERTHIVNPKVTDDIIKILYAGILDKRYGILDLIDQFHKIKDAKYELIICGAGKAENEIKDYVNKDSRILFLGQKPRADVLALQREVSILINPRKNEEFTKYSFPSKTIEYLASGTPTIMYRLDGIPEEYFEYCITCDESIPDDIINKILYLGNKTSAERNEIGKKAKHFILSKKNPSQQVYMLKTIIDKFWDENKK